MSGLFDLAVPALGLLVLVTNVTVQVLKKALWDKLPTQLLALIVGLTVTLLAFFAVWAIYGLEMVWYHVAGAVVLGFFVAYGAMYGFDKLREIIQRARQLRG